MIGTLTMVGDIIPRADKIRTGLIFFLMFFNGALEVVSIGLVLPFIAIFTAEDPASKYPVIGRIVDTFGISNKNELILFASAVFVGVIAIKSIFTFAAHTALYRFNWMAQHRLAVTLLDQYLNSDYVQSSQINSAEIINLLRQSVGFIYGGFVMPLTIALADILMILSTAAIVLFVEPWATLAAVAAVGIPSAILQKILHPRLVRLGQERESRNTSTLRALNETLGALKEATVLQKKGYFLDRFAEQDAGFNRVYISSMMLNQIPRAILETAAIGSIFVVLYVMLRNGDAVDEALAVLALFAAATIRILPATLRVIQGVNQARFARGGIETVWNALNNYRPATAPTFSQDTLGAIQEIVFENVEFVYPDGTEVLKDVNLTLRRGELIGIVGPSGAGKTTFVDLLMGLLRPTSGRILANGADILPTGESWLSHFGYVPQDVFLTDDTVLHNVALGISDHAIDRDAVRRALVDAQLDQSSDGRMLGTDNGVGERGGRLSGGQKQRIGIARALYRDPDVLVLDEPTSALNAEIEREILGLVQSMKRHKTVIIISHRESMLAHCDTVLRVDGGTVAETSLEPSGK